MADAFCEMKGDPGKDGTCEVPGEEFRERDQEKESREAVRGGERRQARR